MALEIDPVPQGQINSDKRKSDAAFACFLNEKYEHCIQLASEISKLAPMTWLFAVSSQLALGQEPATNRFITQDLTSYKSVDFSEEINKCKLADRVIVGQLRETYSTKIIDILNA